MIIENDSFPATFVISIRGKRYRHPRPGGHDCKAWTRAGREGERDDDRRAVADVRAGPDHPEKG
jgi:hypothetical protein